MFRISSPRNPVNSIARYLSHCGSIVLNRANLYAFAQDVGLTGRALHGYIAALALEGWATVQGDTIVLAADVENNRPTIQQLAVSNWRVGRLPVRHGGTEQHRGEIVMRAEMT